MILILINFLNYNFSVLFISFFIKNRCNGIFVCSLLNIQNIYDWWPSCWILLYTYFSLMDVCIIMVSIALVFSFSLNMFIMITYFYQQMLVSWPLHNSVFSYLTVYLPGTIPSAKLMKGFICFITATKIGEGS